MKNALIGHTGFVGSNLDRQFRFDDRFNSSNIGEIAGREYGLVVCAGARAEKWLINADPASDMARLEALIRPLSTVRAERFVLISTIDVYERPRGVDEETKVEPEKAEPYGRNRYMLERFVRDRFPEALIVRLPALFGRGLKKNFIYDLMHRAPRIVMRDRYERLAGEIAATQGSAAAATVSESYTPAADGNMQIATGLSVKSYGALVAVLEKAGFTSLSFTHSESRFQFYWLENLWADVMAALEKGLKLINFATEPVSAREIASRCAGLDHSNDTGRAPLDYDVGTIHSYLYGREGRYMCGREEVLRQIERFVRSEG